MQNKLKRLNLEQFKQITKSPEKGDSETFMFFLFIFS